MPAKLSPAGPMTAPNWAASRLEMVIERQWRIAAHLNRAHIDAVDTLELVARLEGHLEALRAGAGAPFRRRAPSEGAGRNSAPIRPHGRRSSSL
jgi:hypothetical protein